ncbi:hypothetical protein CH274_17750 [Rhodococcus sp. 06-418-5]|uniref:hypothetical protein n=1 Tax=Rhodococcus sp. 06-418-5 TaxID=2022507 RepID=UPI000B9C6A1A|nr:hypothetical protein [Rhodococcus sp. 06-418-5]OZC78093.1 hypothetical protein CH274_17750 [Rhodococcus sp. 06-418-5]
MGNSLVVTIDFGAHSAVVAATVTDYDRGRVEVLPLPAGTALDRADETVHDAITRAVAASARSGGVLTAPDALVLTHPQDWAADQVAVLHAASAAAGYSRNATVVRSRRDPLT